jgi:TolA-binding protein
MNKKIVIMIVTVLLFTCAIAAAQEQEKKKEPKISQWLRGLQQRIALIAPKKVVPLTTGVAGVRGAKEEAQVKLYWKGKKGEEPVSEAELSEFKLAVDSAEKGDTADASKKLEEFMKQFPDSALIPDAKKTLDMVKAEIEQDKKEEKTAN